MKKLVWGLLGVAIMMCNCSEVLDVDGFDSSITEIEKRLDALESQYELLNQEIETLKGLVNSSTSGDYITSVTDILEDDSVIGYTITLSNGESYEVYNGTDGVSSILSVDAIDGIYYWTIDLGDGPEWLLDSDDNKIPVTGSNGLTPEIGASEFDGVTYWTIDGEYLLDGNGDKVSTSGVDGDSFFSDIVVTDENVTFTLSNGTSFVLPRYYTSNSPITIFNNTSVIEYDILEGSATVYFELDMDEFYSVAAKVFNTTYTSIDIYTKSSDYNWGVTLNITESDKSITLVAPVTAATGDLAQLELTAIGNDGVSYTQSAIVKVTTSSGLPDASANAVTPVIEEEEITLVSIPSVVFNTDDADSGVLNVSMTGIQSLNSDTEYVTLYGTGSENQNVWLEVDGVPIGFEVINGSETETEPVVKSTSYSTLAKADLVFIVDNSGSMSAEANTVAEQIIEWSAELSTVMDVQFGCVGYGTTDITGAIDITDVTTISEYFNYSTGTSRTTHYSDNLTDEVISIAKNDYYSGGECGAMAIRFADKYLNFRDGANRIYVNLTDEPNQFNTGYISTWSVESFNVDADTSTYTYDWSSSRGTIHTVMSDGGSYDNSYSTYDEDPRLMSTYTGGTSYDTNSSYTGVTLSSLPVTGTILNSFIFKIDYTPNLTNGEHTLTITIKDPTTGIVSVTDIIITL